MKRSPLIRKTPMKRGNPMPRKKIALKARKKRRQKSILRGTIYRNESYLAAVRTLSCMNCGRERHTQACHSNQLRFGKGGALKASDATAMALCQFPDIGVPGCHATLDQGGKMDKAIRNEFECQMIVLTVLHLIAEKKLLGSDETIAELKSVLNSAGYEHAAMHAVRSIESNLLQVAK